MTVQLQKPYAGRGVGADYTGLDEAVLVANGTASYIAGTGAGVGPAAATPAVRLQSPFGGQGVGALYLGAGGSALVAAGIGSFEATVAAGTFGVGAVVETPTLTPTPVVTPTPAVAALLAASPIAVIGSSRNRQNAVTNSGTKSVFLKTGGMLEWLAAEDSRVGIVTYFDPAQIAPAPGPQNTKSLGGSIFADDGNGFTSMLTRIPRLAATQFPIVVYALTSNSVQTTNPDGTPFSAANYWSIAKGQIEQLRAAGFKVFIESLTPRSFREDPNLAAQWSSLSSVGYQNFKPINALAKAYADGLADVAFADCTTPITDSDGVPLLGTTRDGTHYAPLGAGNAQVVANGKAALDKLMTAGTVYDFATGSEMLTQFSATGGGTVSGAGVSGVVPAGWTLSRDGTPAKGVVTAALETRNGVPGIKLTIDSSGVDAGVIEGVYLTPTAKPAFATGSFYQAKMRVQAAAWDAWYSTGGTTISGSSGAAAGGFRPISAGETALSAIDTNPNSALVQPNKATNLLVRTAVLKVQANGTGDMKTLVWFGRSSTPGTIWLAAPSLRTTPDPATLLYKPSATVAAITSAATVSYPEESTFALQLASTVPGQWSIGGTDLVSTSTGVAQFSVDANYGVLTPTQPLDFESPTDANADNSYQLTVTLTPYDTTKAAVTQSLTVNVTDIDDGFSDNFNRADATTLGSNWTVYGAADSIGVSSNVVRLYSATLAAAAAPQQGDTVEQQVKINERFAASVNGAIALLLIDANNWLGFRFQSNGTVNLLQSVAGTVTTGAIWNTYAPRTVGTSQTFQILRDAAGVYRVNVYQNGVKLVLASGSDDVTSLVTGSGAFAAARRSGLIARTGTAPAYIDDWNNRPAVPIASKVALYTIGLAKSSVSAAEAQTSGIPFTGKNDNSTIGLTTFSGTGMGTVIADGSVYRIVGGVAGETYLNGETESLQGAVNDGRAGTLPQVTLT